MKAPKLSPFYRQKSEAEKFINFLKVTGLVRKARIETQALECRTQTPNNYEVLVLLDYYEMCFYGNHMEVIYHQFTSSLPPFMCLMKTKKRHKSKLKS